MQFFGILITCTIIANINSIATIIRIAIMIIMIMTIIITISIIIIIINRFYLLNMTRFLLNIL